MKTIQIVLNAILSKNIFEYILVDKNLHIISHSEEIYKYLEKKPIKGEDVLHYLPELVGNEEDIKEVFIKKYCLYTLESVYKNDYYVNISIEYCDKQTAIILLHNITSIALSKQKIIQFNNESTLLFNTLKQVVDSQDSLTFVTDAQQIKFANKKFMEYFNVNNTEEIKQNNLKVYHFFEKKIDNYDTLFNKLEEKEKLFQIENDIFTLQGNSLDSIHTLFTLKKVISLQDKKE